MAAEKEACKKLGAEVVAFVQAIGNGVDPEDAAALISLVSAAAAAADDIKSDTDAAVSYVISGASEAFGDSKVG